MLFKQWANGDAQFDKLIPPAKRYKLLEAGPQVGEAARKPDGL